MIVRILIFIVALVGLSQRLQAQTSFAVTSPRYFLQPGDELQVQYRYTPEFNQIVRVQPDGFVALEIVGDLKLGGLTIEQARLTIIEKAKIRLKDPEIAIVLRDFEKPYFVVAGEVERPGKFELREQSTALNAVLLAGGFKSQAKTSEVMIIRRLDQKFSEIKVINLKHSSHKNGRVEDLALKSGDMIVVPQNTVTRVERMMKTMNVGFFINPLQWLF